MSRSERVSLHNLLERTAISGIELQRSDGSFPAGKNGPYGESMTPVRNTSNWLKILSTVYSRTGNNQIRRAAESAIEYLEAPERRPTGSTFLCRTAPDKDSCNGVVGQALVIEALGVAAQHLERPELLETPQNLYRLLPFNEATGVWNRVEVDGSVISIDRTFNHQLILAAASSTLLANGGNNDIRANLNRFLDTLPRNMALHDSGVIIHRLRPSLSLKDIVSILRDCSPELFINPVFHFKEHLLSSENLHCKELAYQAVNLYWLANLKSRMPNHDIWSDLPIESLLEVTERDQYRTEAKNRAGWFRGIVPGFQIAHAINTFKSSPDTSELKYWVSMALDNHYDWERELLINNCADEETFSGMLYQAVALPDLTMEI